MAKHIYSVQEIKSNAKIIKEALARLGVDVKHTQALEAASAVAGYKTWNIASASASEVNKAVSAASKSDPLTYLAAGQHIATVEPIGYSHLVESTPIKMPEPSKKMQKRFKEPRSIVVDQTIDIENFPYANYCAEKSIKVYGGYIDEMGPNETMYIGHSRLFAFDPSDLTDEGYREWMENIASGYDDAEDDYHDMMTHPLILNRNDENELLVYVLEAEKGDDIDNNDYIAWVLGMGIVEVLDEMYFSNRTVKVVWPFYQRQDESKEESKSRLMEQIETLSTVCKSGIFRFHTKKIEVETKMEKINNEIMLIAVVK